MSVSMTFFGTTTWLLDDGETQLLLDAHLTRPSILRVLLGKLQTNAAFVDEVLQRFPMDRLKAIFVSHTHYDHVLDAAYIAQKTGADIYGTVSARNVGLGGGIPADRLHLVWVTDGSEDNTNQLLAKYPLLFFLYFEFLLFLVDLQSNQ